MRWTYHSVYNIFEHAYVFNVCACCVCVFFLQGPTGIETTVFAVLAGFSNFGDVRQPGPWRGIVPVWCLKPCTRAAQLGPLFLCERAHAHARCAMTIPSTKSPMINDSRHSALCRSSATTLAPSCSGPSNWVGAQSLRQRE